MNARVFAALTVLACFCLALRAHAELPSQLSVVSAVGTTPGTGDSGYHEFHGWGTATVHDDGKTVFLSAAPGLDPGNATADDDADWDVFQRPLGSPIGAISLRNDFDFDFGQAVAAASGGAYCIEVREETIIDPQGEKLFWRSFASVDSYKVIAEGSNHFRHPRFSDNGSYLVFEADDNTAVAGDTDSRYDVFRVAAVTVGIPVTPPPTRVSVRATTATTPAECRWPDVSDAGLVVFQSADDGVIEGDSNWAEDVFLWNAGTTTRVNARYADQGDGLGLQTEYPCIEPSISGGGNTVVFVSADPNIVPDDTNGAKDIFCHNRTTGATTRVSLDWLGNEGDGDCDQPDISNDGRFIVFRSDSTNFPGARAGLQQVYLYDTTSGYLDCLSVDSSGDGADADCYAPAISPNGRFVTFSTAAPNLAGAGNTHRQVFLYDRGETSYLNMPPEATPVQAACQQNGEGDANACDVSLSGTDAETATGELQYAIVALPAADVGVLKDTNGDGLAGNGVAFSANLLPLRFTPAADFAGVVSLSYQALDGTAWSRPASITITVADFSVGSLTIASMSDSSLGEVQGDGDSPPLFNEYDVSISGDGRWVAFRSEATSLTAYGVQGIFLRDTVQRKTFLLKPLPTYEITTPVVALDGAAVAYVAQSKLHWQAIGVNGPVESPVVSAVLSSPANLSVTADGAAVAFDTLSALDAADTDSAADVYLWHPATDTYTLVSQGPGGEQTAESCMDPSISPDGRCVAFLTAGSLDGVRGAGTRTVWIKYLESGNAAQAVSDADVLKEPSLSWTGQFLCYAAGATARIADLTQPEGQRAVAEIANVSYPIICPDGRFVCFSSARTDFTLANANLDPPDGTHDQAYRYDLLTDDAAPLSVSVGVYADDDCHAGFLNSDGRMVAFSSDAANLLDDTNGVRDVYHMDLGQVSNTAPVAQDLGPQTQEDTPIAAIDLVGTDADGNDLRFEIASEPAHGILGRLTMPEAGEGNPRISYTPDSNFYGQDTFTYRCRDAAGWSDPATVTITVTEVNDLPEWTGVLADFAIDEDDTVTVDLDLYAADVDTGNPDNPDALSFAFAPDSDTPSWASIDPDTNELNCSPGYEVASNANTAPEYQLRFRVLDGRTGDVAMDNFLTVTVRNVDRAPVLTSAAIDQAAPKTADDLTTSVTASDPDDDVVTLSYRWYLDGIVQPALTADTLLSAETAKGDTWTVEVQAEAAGLLSGWTAAHTPVLIRNTAPTALGTSESVSEDGFVVIGLAGLTDDEDPADVLDFNASPPLLQPAHGTVVINGTQLTYTPSWDELPGGQSSDDTFQFSVSDGEDAATATVTVTVNGTNDAPVLTIRQDITIDPGAIEASLTWDSSEAANIHVSDVDGLVPDDMRITATALPTDGVLRDAQGELVQQGEELDSTRFPLAYQANVGASNVDVFELQVTDGTDTSVLQPVLVYLGFVSLDLQLSMGWNLFSLPMDLTPVTPAELLQVDGIPVYFGVVWEWNAPLARYEAADLLQSKRGYWAYVAEQPPAITVRGPRAGDASLSVSSGWNLLGPVGYGDNGAVPIDDDGDPFPDGTVHGWDPVQTDYVLPGPDGCLRGNGYWIWSSALQTIEFLLPLD